MKRSSQGPLTIWHGMDLPRLAKFFAMRPPFSFARTIRAATLPGFAAYNSGMRLIESLTHGRVVSRTEVNPEPLFIIGHWRSGTTLLHNLICQDKNYGFPNLYQCLFPHHFLLTESVAAPLTRWMVPASRPMDNVPCGWDLPQEDEIAICLLSALGPYLLNAFMEQPAKYDQMLDPVDMRPEDRQKVRETIMYFMKKVSVRNRQSDGSPQPLCLKSPSHSFRVAELIDMFPKARFMFIHRNPYDIMNSTLHLRRTMWAENGLAKTPLPNNLDLAINIFSRLYGAYERDKSLVPAGQLHEVRYESLAADPIGELEVAYSALAIAGFEDLATTLAPQVEKLKNYKRNQFVMEEDVMKYVYERTKDVFERYGYPAHAEKAASA